MKKLFYILLLVVGIGCLCAKIFSDSFAYSYDIEKSVLFFHNNIDKLEKDIELYLQDIDDFIIPNSSFLYSDKLSNNYDFLVRFAIDYVIYNREYYYNDIKKLDSCFYINRDGRKLSTLDYVNVSVVYDIVDFYFGMNNFSIINDDVCMDDRYISLSNYTDDNFNLEIDDVIVTVNDLDVHALVVYKGEVKYLYTFCNENNILKIKNVEVG